MNTFTAPLRRALFVAVALVTGVAAAVVVPSVASADTPSAAAFNPNGPGPVMARSTSMVTADALPTVQIDRGVVWAQTIIGNTVYAGGSFSNTRPAGAAAGTNLTPRANLLSYDITTGNLNTSFNPTLNAQVRAVTKSPDGSRIYVGGDFNKAEGVSRFLIAAYSTSTGQLISTFAPAIGGSYVTSIAATNTTVYVGGLFTQARGVARQNVAAFSASNGALLGWAPTTDLEVDAMVMTPDNSRVILGGRFSTVNGVAQRGLASIDANSGASLPWAANQTITNGDSKAGIFSLSTDGTAVYGTGWVYGSLADGNMEGSFSADPNSGTLNWVADCHGDTYGIYSDGTTAYTVSHAHYCSPVGGYPQTDQDWSINERHSVAFTTAATGVNGPDAYAGGTYYNWQGVKAPSIYDWFPDFLDGNYTSAGQAAWDITGNGQYIVEGGEFPVVNGVLQQGLVRFAVPSAAPKKQGPRLTSSSKTPWAPTLTSVRPGTVRLNIGANWDRDDKTLAYKIIRDGKTAAPVYTTSVDSEFWNLPTIGFTDTGLVPGSTHTYQVVATDPDGNSGSSSVVSVVVNNSTPSAYSQQIVADGASSYWRLGEPTGNGYALDWVGSNDAVLGAGVARGTAGAIVGDADTASTFDGASDGTMATQTAVAAPNTFTEQAWFKTAAGYTAGGKIIGFGNSATGNSSGYDRQIYMDNNGTLWFGVYSGGVQTLNSAAGFNDGKWHQVTATLGANGMTLFVDGLRAASRADITSGAAYSGYWRVGGDNTGGWPNSPWSNYFAGAVDEVAVFPTALSGATVKTEYQTAGYAVNAPPVPSDAYGAAVYNADPDLYWRLGDATGATTAADSGPYGNPGVVVNGVTFGQTGTIQNTTNTAAAFDGNSGYVVSSKQVNNPTVYSEMAWFKTTTTSGGKIIGFGSNNGTSTNPPDNLSGGYDRHVYMQNNGQLVFGAYTGQLNTVVTPRAYNDGGWHQVVATEGADGMKLYVDGLLIGTNSNTGAQNFAGYWRVGGDNTWGSSSPWFAGTIDEAAVFPTVLNASTIAGFYQKATGVTPNAAPTAAFAITSQSGATVSVDGSGSTDSDGTVTGWTWNWGDGVTTTGVTSSHTYSYGGVFTVTLTAKDNGGATATATKQVSVADAYGNAVNADNPFLFWRLGESSPLTTAYDSGPAGNNGNYQGGVTAGLSGSIPGSGATAVGFDGTNGAVIAQTQVNNPTTYSEEAWFRTAAGYTGGGKIIGFGDAASGNSGNYDRHVFMDNSGAVNFGVWTGQANIITTPQALNDGNWHQVVATQSAVNGMKLYVDGQLVGTNPQTGAQSYSGYWRAGGDSSWAANPYFQGAIDDVAFYSTELSAASVSKHYAVGSGTSPTASFTATPTNLNVAFDGTASSAVAGRTISGYSWTFGDGSTASTATPTHAYAAAGTFPVTLTVTDSSGLTSSATKNVSVTAPHAAPVAVVAANTTTGLSVAFDGTGSTASDGASVTGYSWDFGDGSTATTAKPTHPYAAAGSYTVKLTVTDSQGSSSTPSSQTVTVTHAAPVAVVAANTTTGLSVAFDGTGSTASDGASVTGYSWDFGDGSTATTAKPTHPYAAAGSYTVKLTVTDGLGSTSTPASKTITVSAPHANPTAAIAASTTGLTVATDGSGSTATDGATVTSYDWNWGDNTAHGTGATASHAYAAAGTYTVTLAVTDSKGAVGTSTKTVTATHSAPTAVIKSATITGLTVAVDGTGSAASDGATVTYDWNWGDGTAHGSGQTATHTYAGAGSYVISLTVTDSLGSAGTPASRTVVATPPTVAADAFGRSATSSWGSADTGGAWTLSGAATLFSVAGGVGKISTAAASGPTAVLATPAVANTDAVVDVSFDKSAAGGAYYAAIGVRHTSVGDYRAKVYVAMTGQVTLFLTALKGTETTLKSVAVAGLTAPAGTVLRVRLDVTGSSPTTISAKVWNAASAEPTAWTLTATDSTAGLQTAGGYALWSYLASGATNAPVTVSFDNLSATKLS